MLAYQEQVFIPKKAAYDVLEEPCRLLLHKLGDHVAEYSANCVESLICCADIIQTMIIE